MNLGQSFDLIGGLVGFLLTIMIFTYLLGDNALFRIAAYILVGATAGYATVLVLYSIVWQRLALPLIQSPSGNLVSVVPALILGIWLLLKASPRFSRLGSPVVAFLAGIAAAAVIGGALQGTLWPQTSAAMGSLSSPEVSSVQSFNLLNGMVVLVGTLTTLAYFHFGNRIKQGILNIIGQLGRGFIAITLGAIFAGVYATALAAFVGRIAFLWDFIWDMIERFFPIA